MITPVEAYTLWQAYQAANHYAAVKCDPILQKKTNYIFLGIGLLGVIVTLFLG